MTSPKGEKMKARLLNQFSVSTQLKELLDIINNRFDDSDTVLEDLLFKRWIDTAEGVWLDALGVLIGIPRPFGEFEDIFEYKAIGDPDDPDHSFGTVGGGTGGRYTTLNGLPNSTPATDDVYRVYLKAKSAATEAGPTIPEIWAFINSAFGIDATLAVNTVGNIEVTIPTALTGVERRLLVNLAPVAAGVSITIMNWP